MQIQKIQNNSTNFTGTIEKSKLLYRQIEYAKSKSRSNTIKERKTVLQFFNVLKAIKNDGTDNCLTMKREYPKHGRYSKRKDDDGIINVKYGTLQIITDNVIKTLIELGKVLFGAKVINAKPKEMKSALKMQKTADETRKKIWEICNKLSREGLQADMKAADECGKTFEALLD